MNRWLAIIGLRIAVPVVAATVGAAVDEGFLNDAVGSAIVELVDQLVRFVL